MSVPDEVLRAPARLPLTTSAKTTAEAMRAMKARYVRHPQHPPPYSLVARVALNDSGGSGCTHRTVPPAAGLSGYPCRPGRISC